MIPRKGEHDQLALDAFKQQKALTITALRALLQLSITTVRRQLK